MDATYKPPPDLIAEWKAVGDELDRLRFEELELRYAIRDASHDERRRIRGEIQAMADRINRVQVEYDRVSERLKHALEEWERYETEN